MNRYNDIIVDESTKEYVYPGCRFCGHAKFEIAVGLNPRYGWWIQTCKNIGNCSREMQEVSSFQLSLF